MTDTPIERILAGAVAGLANPRLVAGQIDIVQRPAGTVVDLTGHDRGQADA